MQHPVVGPHSVPVLPRIGVESLPTELIAFNDLGRCNSPAQTGIQFFKDDIKFDGVLVQPFKYLDNFSKFKVIFTPDASITSGMSIMERRMNTVASRAVGACYADRGLKVLVTLRWDSEQDYELVSSGVPTHSVYGVSTVGVIRDDRRKREFLKGFDYFFHELQPVGIAVFGNWLPELDQYLGLGVEIRNYVFDQHFGTPPKEKDAFGQIGLF